MILFLFQKNDYCYVILGGSPRIIYSISEIMENLRKNNKISIKSEVQKLLAQTRLLPKKIIFESSIINQNSMFQGLKLVFSTYHIGSSLF